jgi:hypothetical protein
MKNHSVAEELCHADKQTDKRTDITTLTVLFTVICRLLMKHKFSSEVFENSAK